VHTPARTHRRRWLPHPHPHWLLPHPHWLLPHPYQLLSNPHWWLIVVVEHRLCVLLLHMCL
jgi:hypothetical protein